MRQTIKLRNYQADRQQMVLSKLSGSSRGMALRELRDELGNDVADWELKADLAELKALGLVMTVGRGRGAYWFLVIGQNSA